MSYRPISPWKKMPFSRLLVPFASGIIIQWYFQFTLSLLITITGTALLIFIIFFSLPLLGRLRFSWINGVTVTFLFISCGAILAHRNDIRNDDQWFGKNKFTNSYCQVTLQESPIEKTKSYKATAQVDAIINNATKHIVS